MSKAPEFYPTENWLIDSPEFELDPAVEEARRIMNAKNPQQEIARLKQSVEHSDKGIVYAVLKGENPSEYSDSEALVLFNPFANSATPNMLVRAEFVRLAAKKKAVTDEQGKFKPVIMLASPRLIHANGLNLSSEDKAEVKKGNLGPAAKELLGAVADKNYGKVALFGFSQGADLALAGALAAEGANLDPQALGIGDPIAVKERSAASLGLSFLGSSATFQKHISASELEAQTAAIGKHPWSRERNLDFLHFGASAVLVSENRALWHGLTHDKVEEQLQAILRDDVVDKVVLGYSGIGSVVPRAAIEPSLARLYEEIEDNDRLVTVRVAGANHPWGDQLTLLAKLYLMAMS